MKKLSLAFCAAASMVLAALAAPAQAQPHPGGRHDRPQVIVVQPPPPPHRVAPPRHVRHWDHRHDHRYDGRYDHRHDRRAHRRARDRDRDGVPDRHDRFPYNPYRR